MYHKPQRYKELEDRVWQNLNRSKLLPQILARSAHVNDISNYVGVEFHDEFQLNTRTNEYMMWIQIYIRHKEPVQPATPKIYRLTEDITQQQRICAQIWDGVSEEDIRCIAQSSAEEYSKGDKWMDVSQKISMARFLPAIKEGRVCVELIPTLAQYKVYVKK
ncbi:hypothetical protein J4458_01485 [Candidatus Woesearchaeota archaeon]|nr:hypothetical protein [Candidatus Woesearchaeota archaeon]